MISIIQYVVWDNKKKIMIKDGKKKTMEEFLIMWNENFGDAFRLYWINNPKRAFGDHEADGFIGTIERISVALIPIFLMFFTLLITGGIQH